MQARRRLLNVDDEPSCCEALERNAEDGGRAAAANAQAVSNRLDPSPATRSAPAAAASPAPFTASLSSTVSLVNALLERMNATVLPLRAALDAAQSAPLALGSPMSVPDSLTWIRSELAALQALMPCVLSLCTDELRAALVAVPEKAGPTAAQEGWVASCWTVFGRLTSWEDAVRSRTVAPVFQKAQRLMRGLTTEFADAVGRLPAQLHPSFTDGSRRRRSHEPPARAAGAARCGGRPNHERNLEVTLKRCFGTDP
jgi:hypothetical protein